MKTKLWCLSAFLCLAIPATLFAAPPDNDSFDTPALVTGFPATASGSNVDATMEDGEPEDWFDAQASVWFRWTAPTSGFVQIDTLESDFNTILAVWTNNIPTNRSLIAYNDTFGEANQSAVFIPAVSGVTYQIAVYGHYESRGTIALRITNDLLSQISGTVTGPDESTPISGIRAYAYQWKDDWQDWDYLRWADTDADGHFAIGGLEAGTYRVQFTDGAGNFAPETYDDAANLDSGTDIVVPSGTNVSGIDASLATASKISGIVTGSDGITPLPDIWVAAYQWDESGWWEQEESSYTDADGTYTIGGLPAGTYRVQFSDSQGDYLSEAYANAPDLESGTDVVVAAGETATGIDASLAAASKISGIVTGPDGTTPLSDIWVAAYQWNESGWWEQVESYYTDADGAYIIGGLPAGTYRVQFSDGNGDYSPEVFDNVPDLDSGMDIPVATGEIVAGIDASLANASKISGTVTGPDGTTPLPDIWVDAWQWNGSEWEQIQSLGTDAAGNYTIVGLAAGTYRVKFTDHQNFNYVSEVFDNAPDLDSGVDIAVTAGEIVTGIDASLADASRISGTVTGPDGTTPLPGIGVDAWQWNGSEWEQIQSSGTDDNGNYTIAPLAAETYRVRFYDYQYNNYLLEVYDNVPDLDSGTDILVAAGETTTGINASLTHIHSAEMTAVQPSSANDFEIIFMGTPGLSYILQHAATLTSEWNDFGTATTAIAGTNVFAIPSSSAGPFWRIRLQQ